jgi:acetyl-CoA carboxylase carboxyl transferase subunit beta
MRMSWLKREKRGVKGSSKAPRAEVADGLWMKCPSCSEILFRQELEKNRWVCNHCQFHFRVGAMTYLGFLLDPDSFTETHRGLTSEDPLDFKVGKDRYSDKLAKARKKGTLEDAVVTGRGEVEGRSVAVAVMDFDFMGGSMGSVVGEKIARSLRDCLANDLPQIIVSQSGGARMQESILSLMQMAKTSALLGKLRERAIPFISILTHPTTGGVTASFAMLGDLIFAEPKALIGFAGPRVIQQTIQTELPEGFQSSEFQEEHGMVDRILSRRDLRRVLTQSLRFLGRSLEGEAVEELGSAIVGDTGGSESLFAPKPESEPSLMRDAAGGYPLPDDDSA